MNLIRVKVRKLDNSLVIIFPDEVVKKEKIKEDDKIKILLVKDLENVEFVK